jgi:para-aminobenzoate synthetase/4-amino-4-deoxychorismate lyase
MKGTMARSRCSVRDLKNKEFLTTDPKSIAENTMIVDLLRNDLNQISEIGSVQVSRLLQVESYETVHQMTSSIESTVDSNLSFQRIIRHIFPCGSITGAPKRRTMEIIQKVEPDVRRVYTGTLGYITPENDMCFNVAIRTILLRENSGELGVGGGIVYDSDVRSEWEELQLKAQFFTQMHSA